MRRPGVLDLLDAAVPSGADPRGDGEDAIELAPCSSQGQALGVAIDL
jgi:hypothetical protein